MFGQIILGLAALALAMLYEGMDRKIHARMQNRKGPSIFQPFFDFAKLVKKEIIIPRWSNKNLLILSPIFAIAALLLIFTTVLTQESVNIIILIYFLLLSAAFTIIMGFSVISPFMTIGTIREILLMISCEIPIILSLIAVAIKQNSLYIQPGAFILALPFAGLAFLFSLLGKSSKTPFDIPEAETEIVAGYATELSGILLGFARILSNLKILVLMSIFVTFFLGRPCNMLVYIFEIFVLSFVVTIIRTITARLRIDQALKFFIFITIPLAMIDVIRASIP